MHCVQETLVANERFAESRKCRKFWRIFTPNPSREIRAGSCLGFHPISTVEVLLRGFRFHQRHHIHPHGCNGCVTCKCAPPGVSTWAASNETNSQKKLPGGATHTCVTGLRLREFRSRRHRHGLNDERGVLTPVVEARVHDHSATTVCPMCPGPL